MRAFFAAIVFFLAAGFFRISAEKKFTLANTKIFSKEFAEVAQYGDFWLVLLGHRKVASDIAFIQLLQYYGGSGGAVEKKKERELRNKGVLIFGEYGDFYKYALRCIRLDRNFEFFPKFTAAALAWVQDRDDEAIKILTESLEHRKDFYQLALYLGAINYKKAKAERETILYLEEAIKFPDCPELVKNLLAEIYEKKGDWPNALRVWKMLLDSPDPVDREKAEKNIREILEKINAPVSR